MQPKTVTRELTAMLWLIVNASIERFLKHDTMGYGPWFGEPWKQILQDWWVFVRHEAVDEFPDAREMIKLVKRQIRSENYIDVYGFIEFLVRRRDLPHGMREAFEMAFEKARAPYRIVEGSIIAFGTGEEAEAAIAALDTIAKYGPKGVQAHLRKAADALSSGDWPGAVRESIHSVESAARSLEPSASTLEPALTKLSTMGYIHPAMKTAFSKLYGYTSDEEGVRHSLLNEESAKVTEADAIFMFGACASFSSYMLTAARTGVEK
jgi:hypothetical protein